MISGFFAIQVRPARFVIAMTPNSPSHDEHAEAGNSVWRMEQAATEALKGSNVIALPERHSALVEILDDAAEFKIAA